MALYGDDSKPVEICPEGTLPAVLLEITESMKEHPKGKGMVRKWSWKFEIQEPKREDGECFLVWLNTYTSGPFVRDVAGKLAGDDKPIDETLWTSYDVQQLEGCECTLKTKHNESNGRTYCNIDEIVVFGDPFSGE